VTGASGTVNHDDKLSSQFARCWQAFDTLSIGFYFESQHVGVNRGDSEQRFRSI